MYRVAVLNISKDVKENIYHRVPFKVKCRPRRGNFTFFKATFSWNIPKRLRSSHPEVFCRKGALKNFAKFTEKNTCVRVSFFNKVAGLRCFTVNFAKLFRTYLFIEHLPWLLQTTASIAVSTVVRYIISNFRKINS